MRKNGRNLGKSNRGGSLSQDGQTCNGCRLNSKDNTFRQSKNARKDNEKRRNSKKI